MTNVSQAGRQERSHKGKSLHGCKKQLKKEIINTRSWPLKGLKYECVCQKVLDRGLLYQL